MFWKFFLRLFFEFVCIYKFLWQIFLSISQFHESVTIKFFESNSLWPRGYVARTLGFHPDDPGTNPGCTFFAFSLSNFHHRLMRIVHANLGLQRLVKASKGYNGCDCCSFGSYCKYSIQLKHLDTKISHLSCKNTSSRAGSNYRPFKQKSDALSVAPQSLRDSWAENL